MCKLLSISEFRIRIGSVWEQITEENTIKPVKYSGKYMNHLLQHLKTLQKVVSEHSVDSVSETSAYNIQTPGYHPKERIQHSEHGESVKIGI
jgi:hypothetical protein